MLRLSKMADYAALMLATMADRPAEQHTSVALAERTGLARPTVSKLLKALAQSGLVVARRGINGGYSLARAPAAISAVDMIEAIDGPFAVTECTLAPGLCGLESNCRLGAQWRHLSLTVRRALADITLEDLIGEPIVPRFTMPGPTNTSPGHIFPARFSTVPHMERKT